MKASEAAITRIKQRFGPELEHLSISERYIGITVLAAALVEEKPVFQVCANQKYIEQIFRRTELREYLFDLPILAMPNVIKFLSESIPASF